MINKFYSVLKEIYRDCESSVVSNVVFFYMFAIFHSGAHGIYTPGIYAGGYIVFALTFVCSYVRPFVCSFFR